MAVVGAGNMGTVHAAAYARLPDARVRVVVDHDLDRAAALAARFGARADRDLDAALGDPEVQAVSVCLPTRFHCATVLAAVAAGKHVLCEKPIAWTLAEADRMIEAAERAGVHFLVGHVLRFWPEYVAAKRLVESGELGAVRALSAGRVNPPAWWTSWIAQPAESGGAVLDLLVHDADVGNWFLGMPARVTGAQGFRSETGAWDHVQALVAYPSGIAALEASYAMPPGGPSEFYLRILAERGAITFRRSAPTSGTGEVDTTLVALRPDRPPEPLAFATGNGYDPEIAHFVRCIQDDRPSLALAPKHGRAALELALAVRLALETGASPSLPLPNLPDPEVR